jgi:hypothetical protein
MTKKIKDKKLCTTNYFKCDNNNDNLINYRYI